MLRYLGYYSLGVILYWMGETLWFYKNLGMDQLISLAIALPVLAYLILNLKAQKKA